jgi:folate-binding protein YgfZ
MSTTHAEDGAAVGPAAPIPAFAAAGADPAAELEALRRAAGLVDRRVLSPLRVSGSSRAAYLHRVAAQSLADLAPGAGGRAALLERTGKIIDIATVHAFPDHLLWISAAGRGAVAAAALRRTIFRDDVRVETETPRTALFLWSGPLAEAGLAGILASGRAPVVPLAWESLGGAPAGGAVRLVPAEPAAFLVLVEAASAAAIAEALVGSVPGGRVAGDDAFAAWRVLHGVPEGEFEIDAEANPLELGLDDAVDMCKGCFTGQEAIAKMITHHAVRRRLVGLRLVGQDLPPRKAALRLGTEEVGRVTTAVRVAEGERAIALALVRTESTTPGTRLEVAGGSDAEVVPLPFEEAGG